MIEEKTNRGTCMHALEYIVKDALGEEFWKEVKDKLEKDKLDENKGSLNVLRILRAEIRKEGLDDPDKFAKKYPTTNKYIKQRYEKTKTLGYDYDGLVYEDKTATWKGTDYDWEPACQDPLTNGHWYWNELDHSITFLICKIKEKATSKNSPNDIPLSAGTWGELGLHLFLAEAFSHKEKTLRPIKENPFDDIKFDGTKIVIGEETYEYKDRVKFAEAIGIYEEFFEKEK